MIGNVGLLLALTIFLVLVPQLETTMVGHFLSTVGLSFLYLTGLLANRNRPIIFRVGLAIGSLALVLTWIELTTTDLYWAIADQLSAVLFLAFTAVMILITVLKEHAATPKAILGAICVYLLLGVTWAMMYRAVELVESEPLSIPERITVQKQSGEEVTGYSQIIYFSFVTMSTLGYGDIQPKTAISRTLTWTQAVVGQFYIAVLVAWLVSAIPRKT